MEIEVIVGMGVIVVEGVGVGVGFAMWANIHGSLYHAFWSVAASELEAWSSARTSLSSLSEVRKWVAMDERVDYFFWQYDTKETKHRINKWVMIDTTSTSTNF